MNQRVLCFIALLFVAFKGNAQQDFYAIEHIPEIRIYFEQSNWDELLDSLYIIGDEARLGGSVSIDGTMYEKVGVRYKGYSSYSSTRDKNPFNIDLDYVLPDQNHLGFHKLKLSNVIQDPSFVREALSYEIARKYMPASRANFANVYVNDTLIGLYTNVEGVNSDFLMDHFNEGDNTFVKCNPETVSLNGENSNLSNSPGTDVSNYYSLYDMKSGGDYDWDNFYELVDVLNDDPGNIESVLNVDRALWMHALNYTLINFDSYVGYAQNYYLYQMNNRQFQPILWDLNMSFASYRLSDASDNWDGFTVTEAKTIDPLQHLNSYSVQPRPLIRNLLENDQFKRMYLAHIKTIVEENFENDDYYTRGQLMQSVIDADVQADTNKFYTYQMFLDNLDSTVSDLVEYPGIKDLMEARSTYLLNYPGMDDAPVVAVPVETTQSGLAHSDLWITSEVQSNQTVQVYLSYRQSEADRFEVVQMYDDGLSGDGAAGDGVYGAYFSDPMYAMQYYVYAENDSAGTFSPARAAYEYYTVDLRPTSTDVVINEAMVSNTVVSDNHGEYDSWMEIHASGEAAMHLEDLMLVSLSTGDFWHLPDVELSPGEYYLLWLDGTSAQGENHCDFAPEIGDTLSLQFVDGTVIQDFILGKYSDITSTGRWPDGSGEFRELRPTPGEENQLDDAPLFDEILFVYPNPASTELNIRLNANNATLTIYTVEGKQVLQQEIVSGVTQLNTSTWTAGFYMAVATGDNLNELKRIVIDK